MKKCPYCAELIQDDAIFCRYCRKEISPNLHRTFETPTKLDENKISNYEYKLDAEKIKKQKKIDFLDLIELADIATQSYSYPEDLSKYYVNLRLAFITAHHMPALMYFDHVGLLPNFTEQYFTQCIPIYTALEFIVIGAQAEFIRGSLSKDETEIIIDRVIPITVFGFLVAAKVVEDRIKEISWNDISRISYEWNNTFLPAFKKYVKDELLSSLLYFKTPTSKRFVDGQTPFVLELKRLYKMLVPFVSGTS